MKFSSFPVDAEGLAIAGPESADSSQPVEGEGRCQSEGREAEKEKLSIFTAIKNLIAHSNSFSYVKPLVKR